MLESPRLYVGPTSPSENPDSMEVHAVQGISLIHADVSSHEETAAALKVLRGFRAAGRRVVLCDTSQLTSSRQLGGEIVTESNASVFVSCGPVGREVAIGARDAGLELANVVVCQDASSACELLSCRLLPGDTLLLLAVEKRHCGQLIERLNQRISRPLSAAA